MTSHSGEVRSGEGAASAAETKCEIRSEDKGKHERKGDSPTLSGAVDQQ